MNKRMLLVVVGIIVAVVGFLFLTQPTEDAGGEASNHTVGAGNSGVVLVEYGDFQCPGCGAFYSTLKQVKEKYGDEITFQFRHFPLESIHKNARAAARAAEAANLQGKFWEMHDYLFENQSAWENASDPLSIFESYAQNIGVADIAKFSQDYRSSSVNAVINADLAEGRRLNVAATPSFLLNGQLLEPSPANTLEAFSALIDEAISNNNSSEQNQTEDQTDEASKPEEESPSQE